jgi:hypothetical protein
MIVFLDKNAMKAQKLVRCAPNRHNFVLPLQQD